MKILFFVLLGVISADRVMSMDIATVAEDANRATLIVPSGLLSDLDECEYSVIKGAGLEKIRRRIVEIKTGRDQERTSERLALLASGSRFITSHPLQLRIVFFTDSCPVKVDVFESYLVINEIDVHVVKMENLREYLTEGIEFKKGSLGELTDILSNGLNGSED